MSRLYTIDEIASATKCPKTTLRYYEKEGLMPPIRRNSAGVRVFTEDDLEKVWSILCLKATGMPNAEIKKFEKLLLDGERTYAQQRRMILIQKREILKKMEELQRFLEHTNWKIGIYNRFFSLPDDCEDEDAAFHAPAGKAEASLPSGT